MGKSSENMEERPDESIHLMVTPLITWAKSTTPISPRRVPGIPQKGMERSEKSACPWRKILVFSKGTFSRENLGRKSTISKEKFLEFTKSVWTFKAEPATKIGHPAPFPVEPPYRLISLSTFEREVVLDPFMGSGQTGIAALQMKRHDVGYETNRGYVRLAERRLREFSFSRKVPRLFDLGKNRLSK